jgi:hypothetical protein
MKQTNPNQSNRLVTVKTIKMPFRVYFLTTKWLLVNDDTIFETRSNIEIIVYAFRDPG